jgi:hypothetical protein
MDRDVLQNEHFEEKYRNSCMFLEKSKLFLCFRIGTYLHTGMSGLPRNEMHVRPVNV